MSSRGVRCSATRPADSIPGGDPQRIPDLTYPDFKAFHRRYYHPSNARFGDDDSDERLRLLDWWLRAFDPIAINSTVTLQKRSRAAAIAAGLHCGCGEARRKRESYGDGQLDDRPDSRRRDRSGPRHPRAHPDRTPASPLRNNSGLGEDIAGRGLDDELLQPMLSVGLKGIDPSGAEKVEALVLETLRALASKRSNFACARTISAHFRVASRQCCTRSRLGSTTATRRRRWRSRRRFSERAESDETELARSIIGTIGDIDAYQRPDAKGYTSMQQYLAGETEEVRQRRRDQILGARVNDFRAFADALTDLTAHAAPSMRFVQPTPVALGSCTYRG